MQHTVVFKSFRTSANKSRHGVNLRTTFRKLTGISGQRPGLKIYIHLVIAVILTPHTKLHTSCT